MEASSVHERLPLPKKKNSFTYFLLIFSEIISCKNFFFRVTSWQFMLLIFEAAN